MFREHCSTVNDRKGNMQPEACIRGQQGYISVFGFSDLDAAMIKSSGHSRGFKDYQVGSSCLIMDFDDGESSARAVSELLQQQDATHWLYTSGGKGMHLYAVCQTGYGYHLPSQHHELAMGLSAQCDPSIYRHNSLIRLPGTVHERTGHRKELVHSFRGCNTLTLPEPKLTLPTPKLEVTDPEALYFMFAQVTAMLESNITPGRRHDVLWRFVNDCHRAGLSFTTTVELCLTINKQFKPPKDEADVLRVVEARYAN